MSTFQQVIGKKGKITYTYQNKFIYSQYDPEREAAKYLTTIKCLQKNVLTFCGADYMNQELLKKEPDLNILSFEPDRFPNNKHHPKIRRFYSINDLKQYILNCSIEAKHLTIITWPAYLETNQITNLQYLREIKTVIEKSTFSTKTAIHFEQMENNNIKINLKKFHSIEVMVSQIQLNEKMAILAASGNSLVQQIKMLKKHFNNYTLFCFPSTLSYLLHHQIIPDFIILVDPGYGSFYHLADITHFDVPKPINLILPLSVSPSIFNLIKHFRFLFFDYHHKLTKYIFSKISKVIQSAPEGSVFFNSLKIIRQMGFTQLLLLGQDFSYYKNRLHVPGGCFETYFTEFSHYFFPIEKSISALEFGKSQTIIIDQGKKITSDISLKIYYQHLLDCQLPLELVLPSKSYNTLNGQFKTIELGKLNHQQKVFSLITSKIDITRELLKKMIND
ncbi:MAG: DUF115 domain-containing protein [Spirochaetes bacterium]|nr:DUF115 domain-containing protein [Spirochaetota bacterium]